MSKEQIAQLEKIGADLESLQREISDPYIRERIDAAKIEILKALRSAATP